jgi:hypothetical protein
MIRVPKVKLSEFTPPPPSSAAAAADVEGGGCHVRSWRRSLCVHSLAAGGTPSMQRETVRRGAVHTLMRCRSVSQSLSRCGVLLARAATR